MTIFTQLSLVETIATGDLCLLLTFRKVCTI